MLLRWRPTSLFFRIADFIFKCPRSWRVSFLSSFYSQNSHNGNGGYSDNQWNNRNNQNDYGYNKDRDNRDRGDMSRNQYDYPRDNQRGFEDHSYRSWGRDSRRHRMYRNNDRD